jgi:putative transposase
VIEDLAVKNMVRNRPLAKAIADCGRGTFRRMIEYKAARAGRQLIVIDRWYPSSEAYSSPGREVVNVPRLTHIITSSGGIACVRSVLIRVRRSAR